MVTMLYHPDGNESVWGIKCRRIVVDDSEVPQYIKQGWFKNPKDFTKKKPPRTTKAKAVKNENEG